MNPIVFKKEIVHTFRIGPDAFSSQDGNKRIEMLKNITRAVIEIAQHLQSDGWRVLKTRSSHDRGLVQASRVIDYTVPKYSGMLRYSEDLSYIEESHYDLETVNAEL